MKTRLRLMLAGIFVLLLAAAPALGEAPQTFTMMGLEEGESARDWNENLFFARMAEITGVSFTFEEYTDLESYQKAKDAAFAQGTLPDVLFKAHLSEQEEIAYHESGQLVDLAPYLEEHAPNVYAILQAREDWRSVITQPGGAIVSLPVLNGADRQCCIWVNRVWLEALELEMPTTIEEYTEVLRAFRDGDPNANGQRDEVPLSLIGPWEAKFLMHAWGLTPNDYNLSVDDAGQVQYAPLDPAFRSFVEWLHMASQEGLINDDAFRVPQNSRTTELSSTQENGVMTIGGMISATPFTLLDMDKATEFTVMLPLVYEGRQVYRQLLGGVGRGTFAITSACEDIPAVLRWVDYLYTEEGGRLAIAGAEGEDYVVEEDGSWHWVSGEDYIRLAEIVEKNTISGDSVTPGLEPADFMRNTEILADNYVRRQTDTIRSYLVEPFPTMWPTDEAAEARIAELQEALATYVDTSIANFAMGKTPLTEESWQEFEDTLHSLGVDEFISLWQAKYDAYLAE